MLVRPLLFMLFAGAIAAPQRFPNYGTPPFFDSNRMEMGMHRNPSFNEDVFDSWDDFSREMKEMDDMFASRDFPGGVSNEGIVGNEYQINITLTGFEEKDIVVKVREGLLTIQAVHKYADKSQSSYYDVKNLPDNVNVTGTWIFVNNELKIVFPLKDGAVKPTEAPVFTDTERKVPQSRENIHRRREADSHPDEDNQDADIGLRGHNDAANQNREIFTTESIINYMERLSHPEIYD